MSNRVCFLVYKDWEAVLQEFDDATFRELITAIFKYGFDREEHELSPMARIAMKLIKPVMERDWQKYIDRANINKQNGAKGGRPQKANGLLENPENPMGYEKPNGLLENQTVSEKPNGSNKLNIKYKKQENINEKDNLDNISSVSTDMMEQEIMEVMEFYNQTAATCKLPKCLKLSDKRKKQIRARIRESGKEKVFEAITIASQSEFMNGMNDSGWRADIEFITSANKFLLILEGRYSHKSNGNINNGSNTERAVEVGRKAIESILNDDDI